jgi:hypothetical protein
MIRAIFWGGLACGVLDISVALVVYGLMGTSPMVLLHFIASGALGMRSFYGGAPTAALGFFFEFVISTSAAAVYVTASRVLPVLVERPLICGPAYGVAVYYLMNLLVVAHSAAPQQPFSLRQMIVGVIIHICCVGTPIALAASRFAPATRTA